MGEAPFLKVSCATTTPEAPFLRSVGEGKIFLKGAGAPQLAERHKETSVRHVRPAVSYSNPPLTIIAGLKSRVEISASSSDFTKWLKCKV